MAVAADSSRRNFPSIHFSRITRACLWHAQVAAKTINTVKLQIFLELLRLAARSVRNTAAALFQTDLCGRGQPPMSP